MAWVLKNGKPVYNQQTIIYSLGNAGSGVEVPKDCFSIQYTNVGTAIAKVNNQVIYPGVPGTSLGDSRSMSAHEGEVYVGDLVLQFDQPVTGLICAVEIVFLTYCDNERD